MIKRSNKELFCVFPGPKLNKYVLSHSSALGIKKCILNSPVDFSDYQDEIDALMINTLDNVIGENIFNQILSYKLNLKHLMLIINPEKFNN